MNLDKERPLNALTALLAADHLQDLLREAEDERRAHLVNASRPSKPRFGSGLGHRIAAAARRLVRQPSISVRPRTARAVQEC